ncbi:MAG: NIPSNAP family protein [Gemmataceae bacterium]
MHLAAAAAVALTAAAASAAEKDTRLFELRVYTAAPGKLDALNARFRDHTVKLFAKHGMTNLWYATPVPNPENKLYYVLAHKDRAARDASFKAFVADPEWKKASSASEKDGKLVAKIEEVFMTATDYSPAVETTQSPTPRTFELRTYTTSPGNLDALNARFRDHTVKLFAKHGMTNLWYWTLAEGSKGRDVTLVYLLAHPSKEARDKAFAAFRDDPDWNAARTASEKKAGGSLTAKDGVKSILLAPTDYSPLK